MKLNQSVKLELMAVLTYIRSMELKNSDSLSLDTQTTLNIILDERSDDRRLKDEVSRLIGLVGGKYTHASALFVVGSCYQHGIGVAEIDLVQARQFFEAAAALGCTSAMSNLGTYYLDQKNYIAAVDLFRQASALGSSLGKRRLASCYRDGLGVPEDLEYARKLSLQVGSGNHYMILDWLGQSYEESGHVARACLLYHAGSNDDHESAVKNFSTNHPLYCFKSLKEAITHFQVGESSSDAETRLEALSVLGFCHQLGLNFPFNLNKAVEYYKQAIALGDTTCTFDLLICYQSLLEKRQIIFTEELSIYCNQLLQAPQTSLLLKKEAALCLAYGKESEGTNYENALKQFEDAVTIVPTSSQEGTVGRVRVASTISRFFAVKDAICKTPELGHAPPGINDIISYYAI